MEAGGVLPGSLRGWACLAAAAVLLTGFSGVATQDGGNLAPFSETLTETEGADPGSSHEGAERPPDDAGDPTGTVPDDDRTEDPATASLGEVLPEEPLNVPCQEPVYLASEDELLDAVVEEEPENAMGGITMAAVDGAASRTAPEHSTTNVQVEGVDEPDIVKTDGTYIYTVSNGTVVILRAYPPSDAAVVARIPLPDRTWWWGWYSGWWWGWSWHRATPAGLFLQGDRLVVLLGSYYTTIVPVNSTYRDWQTGEERTYTYNVTVYHPLTTALVYDIEDRASPVLYRNLTVSGSFRAARMIGEYVYLVSADPLPRYPGYPVILPAVWYDGWYYRLYPRDLWWPWGLYYPDELVLLTSFSLKDQEAPETEALLVNAWTQVYVSQRNIYLIGHDGWWWGPWFDMWWNGWWLGTGNTTIHKVAIHEGDFCYVASNTVPGWPISEWSFDERDGFLRVATETQEFNRWTTATPESSNVYVLNETLVRIGALEGIAPGEDMTAVRYLGDRAFLVTYGAPEPTARPTDPLFVIDLSDPERPWVLGELTIPGFSTYLHPFGENHLLGIGRDDCPGATNPNPWWPRCLKLSLFDVSDLQAPREVARYFVGEGDWDWSSSDAGWDHHAFLFVPSRGLLLIPVTWSHRSSDLQAWTYFDGMYAFTVSLDAGFGVAWTDTHYGAEPCPGVEYEYYGGTYTYFQNAWACDAARALYIGEVAYTVSQGLVRMRDLETGEEIGEVLLM